MCKRFVVIWFPYLKTDWYAKRETELSDLPFVLYASIHNRMVVTAANKMAESKGISTAMVLADAKAIIPSLQVKEDPPGFFEKKILAFSQWFIRYSPIVSIASFDNIIIDASGCAHLWGSEENYLNDIVKRMRELGYTIRISMADTIGTAWAMTHYGEPLSIIGSGQQAQALAHLPPASLRIEPEVTERLHKLGLHCIYDFMKMPSAVLRRRFGNDFIRQLQYALGYVEEYIKPIEPVPVFHKRLQCMEPISTAIGIEIALQNVLETICVQLKTQGKGLRTAIFKAYRLDGKVEKIDIMVNRPSNDETHLFKLFALKINTIEPSLGIELFTLDALKVEETNSEQEQLWNGVGELTDYGLAQLIDKLSNKIGEQNIVRFLPDEHYLPERSIKKADDLHEHPSAKWNLTKPRPVCMLQPPEPIQVTAPIPDYPPMLFRYKNKVHKIVKADGPERIEQEWWINQGRHRDYYFVEDEQGCRYWLFRSGHYDGGKQDRWFLHGYCA